MKPGDKINYKGIEWTVFLIENDTVHLIDNNNNGIAVLITEL